jgi:hypothetical protein
VRNFLTLAPGTEDLASSHRLTVGTSLLVSLSLSLERTKALILVDYRDSHPSEADTRKFLTFEAASFYRADGIDGAVKNSLLLNWPRRKS